VAQKLAEYRKAVVAVGAAAVNIAVILALPITEEEVKGALAVFDAVAAYLVARVPNADPQ
jgi:hypothetical protein